MKISSIKINNFKRFTELTISEIPETARLILLVGPNGSGKTSVFEAFNHWYNLKGYNHLGQKEYFEKNSDGKANNNWCENKVTINFYNQVSTTKSEELHGKFYFRTAYRNESDFTISGLNKQNDPTKSVKHSTLMQNDITVSENYQRLISQTLSGIFEVSNNSKTVEQLREELIGKIKTSLGKIFEDLNISSIGDPLSNGSFYFEKGISKDFHYKNLSAGEKSVFDLILDMIIKSTYYSDTIFCIDEPEAHMHTRLQAKVLQELYNLTPISSQLWISTHSIGMLKQAEDLEKEHPGSVVFLDFDNRDFDLTENIYPAKIDKTIWNRFFDLAFADFSQLISPKRIVFCEGTSQGRKYKDFDAQIYGKIFEQKYHDTKFISIGSSSEIENIENQSVKIVSNILKSSSIIKFVDRDDKSPQEIGELLDKNIKTSSKRHIESYLLDDEIITKLCQSLGKDALKQDCLDAKIEAVRESMEDRGNPTDDIKSASGKIFTELKRILSLTQCGNNKCAFIRDTIAPLVTEETDIYRILENEIFG
ncbi:AAA family ATPase [Flavobacterium psychrophilum]|uniref:AAA family ATPase n=1 Tax=Flavobacterium psychrophilum TaxID=96345 RepID=A0A7U2NE80_FLAPS|nr:ATP-binding protein [Flavobacterium psychrophilum]EKT4499364.1 AAA family ATPase [Flavobacterium psychrophilum]ELM3649737.1 AAA family ATPase [Flavobacterium psychrophilum]ELM3671053.1 AAA family ATPase [Flavobacterium psychrophilum]ELM3725567.1 AAA family ATPase [Flavobacterium psychrophilum]ELY1979349.1 AAA family ATPase [Flavobacterium psychrophilum]